MEHCLVNIHMSTILGLASCQIDYVQAFYQAALDDPVYLQILKTGIMTLPLVVYGNMLTLHFIISPILSS